MDGGRVKRLKGIDKRHVWHPFTQMKEWEASDPLVIEKGVGNYLIDTEGNRYLDGVSSLWVTVHGHRKREIDAAVRAQLENIAHSTLLGLSNVPSIELAARLVRILPKGLTRVFYSDDGSTAVEIALKMSFQYWEQKRRTNRKRRFIAFTGAYHGDTFGSMSVGEIDIFVDKYKPLLFGAFRAPYPYCYRCPLKKDYPSCKIACLDKFEGIIKKHHGEIAGCIIEPLVQGAAGMVTAPDGFLSEVRRLTAKYNVHLIADEVATGFGRTGAIFACDIEKVAPDLVCLAKGLTGGYLPLAVTVATDEIYRAFLGRYDEYRAFFHGHTYTGNPLGCAAAIANLDIFEKERTIERLRPRIALLAKLLDGFKDLAYVGDVRHRGLMCGVELVRDKRTKAPFKPSMRVGRDVCLEARERGVIIRPLGDTVVVMPPLSVTERQLRTMMDVVYDSIEKVTEAL